MPLQINTLSPTTPFLLSYAPYQLPPNTQIAEVVDDMISYNLVLNESPSRLNYVVGAEGTYKSTFTIKNITTNIVLDLQVKTNPDVFLTNLQSLTFSLSPDETKSFVFELNKPYLDSITKRLELSAYVDVIVTNRQNGSAILTNLNTTRIPAERVPAVIDVV